MKKAIALGILLGASFVSFAFAMNQMPVDKDMKNGEVLHLDMNGTNYYNINLFDTGGGIMSFKIDFTPDMFTGYFSMVETPKPRPEFKGSTHVIWISRTPGGEPVFPKTDIGYMLPEAFIRFYHPNMKAEGGRFATDQFNFLDYGTYYVNVQANAPTGINVTYAGSPWATSKYRVHQGATQNVNKSQEFVAAPVTLNSSGVPIVTSTYDLNVRPATRLIPATGGTKSVAIAFPTTKGGMLMMVPGVSEYVRPDRTEVNISTKPNDFTPIQPACNQINEISSEITLQWVTKASDQPSWGACILEPNKIYYFNIRYVKADGTTACTQATCGAYMDLPPLGTITVPTEKSSSSNTSCSLLSKNLGVGSKDALTNGEVTKLQTFLQGTYFSAEPTGYFGPKTTAAIKAFQGAYGIEQVGSVGPKTRAKINELSCAGTSLTPPTQASTVSNSVAKSVVSTPPTGSFMISSPWAGAVLKNDGSRALFDTIMWTPPAGVSDVSIALYDTEGNLVKPITSTNVTNPSDPNAIGMYEWRYTPGIEDGRYKIVITGGSYRAESGIFTLGSGGGVMTTTNNTNQNQTPSASAAVSKTYEFTGDASKFKMEGVPGQTVAFKINFAQPNNRGLVTLAETADFGDGGAKFTAWISRTPGGEAIGSKQTWQYTGGSIHFMLPPGYWWNQVNIPYGTYYFNVTRNTANGDGTTATQNSNSWVQLNVSYDATLAQVNANPNTATNSVLPVAKRWDDFMTTLTTRVTVDLSGTQVGSVAFGSWRNYSGTPTSLDMLSVTATPAFTYPVGMVDLVVSPIEGSFTPISPECSLQTEQTLALERNATMMRFTTKKFEELTEAQKRLGYCILQPNTKYYMNVRFVDKNGATTCTKDRCGIYIDVNYSAVSGSSAVQGNSEIIPVSAQTTLTAPAIENINFAGLKRGINEVRVSRLKSILNTIPTSTSAGCANLSTSNTLFGPTTEECVKIFQSMNELKPTGVVDELTNTALNKAFVR